MIPRGWLLVVVVTLQGCAVYDPTHVWRYHADFNTERQLSGQWVDYSHQPPKHVRMRLAKWNYNVGPSPLKGDMTIPAESPVLPLAPAPVGVEPSYRPDLLEESEPPLFPTFESLKPPKSGTGAPPAAVEPYGPTAGASQRPITQTTWMFSGR